MSRFNDLAENIENKRNKVTAISASSTHEQYPTAKAVAEAISSIGGSANVPEGVIRSWQPNTEYKEGDVVLVPRTSPAYTYWGVCTCSKDHKSGDFEEDFQSGCWLGQVLNAYAALYDAKSQRIHTTYATKNELTEAIGQALEGDY